MEDFTQLANTTGAATTDVADPKKAAKKAKLQEMANLLRETLSSDPTFATKMRTYSDSLIVVNTLGYGDSGNIVVDPTKPVEKEGDKRALVSTSQIVGYRVQNVGAAPIKYLTEEFTKNDEGVWVGQQVQRQLEPGVTVDFTRKYMTIFCSQPEISFALKNGKIIRGSGTVKNGDVDAELEAHYFNFTDKDVKVNSDTTKLNVAQKAKGADGTTKWVVKPEFEKTFGALNNAKTSAKRARTAKGSKYTTQDMAANFIFNMLKESGQM